MFKLKNPHQLLIIWIDGFPYRLGRQTNGEKSGMAKELVDYDFDCLLFCWSSAVCPFQMFLVLIVPSAMKRLPAIHFHLWQTNWEISDLSAGRVPRGERSEEERAAKVPIFHFLTKIPPFCWSSFRYFQVSPQFGTERELILKANSFPMAPQRVHIPSRQTITKRTN